jgi:hypothetical protein
VLLASCAGPLAPAAQAQPVRVSVSSSGVQANQQSTGVDISETGRFVVFESFASNLVPGDGNSDLDVFLHDRDTDQDGVFDELDARSTVRLTRPGVDPNGQSFIVRITPDGRFVVFTSNANNLIAPPASAPFGARNVFRYDRLTGALIVVSQNNAGQPCNEFCTEPSISDDGRYVVFLGRATNLDPALSEAAIYLRDVEAGTTTRLSPPQPDAVFDATGSTIYSVSRPTISGDGQVILFAETENLLDPQQRSFWDGALTLINRTTAEVRRRFAPGWLAALARDGRAFVACGTEGESLTVAATPYWQHIATGERRLGRDRPGSFICIESVSRSGRYAGVRDQLGAAVLEDFRNRSAFPMPSTGDVAFSGGDQWVAFDSSAALVAADTNGHPDIYVQPAPAFFDRDADTLNDAWEVFFGLSTFSSTGVWGPDGDPDGDGLTNLQEQAAGSHPRGMASRYLAEGATGDFFETRIALANHSAVDDAAAVVRFDKADGTSVSQLVPVPARGRSSVIVGAAGLGTASFSTVVESNVPIVVDRLMTWDGRRYGSHAETAAGAPATQWFLAEGTTVLGFQLFYLLQNPQSTATTATVRFLLPSGSPIVRTYELRPRSRTTIYVNVIPELGSTDVSADISATQPIAVERAMYRSQADQSFALGHAAAGIPQAATNWFLAEGATGAFFDTYVLVANPSAQAATVTMDFLRDDGTVVQRVYDVQPSSRFTVFADGIPGLGAATFGTRISSTMPVVVERAMYWAGGFFDYYEGHVSAASTVTGSSWVLAEGEVGGTQGAETFVLIANTAAAPVSATVYALAENPLHLSPVLVTPRQLTLPANSRVTVPLSSLVPAGSRSAVQVVETGPDRPGALVVEGAIYWHHGGVVWAAGAALPATRIF